MMVRVAVRVIVRMVVENVGVVTVFVRVFSVRMLRVPGFPVMGDGIQAAVEEGEPDQDDEQSGDYAQPGIQHLWKDVARQVEGYGPEDEDPGRVGQLTVSPRMPACLAVPRAPIR